MAAEGGGAHARCVREVSRDVGRAALTGSALSIFDVLSSAFGVLAPLYNGFFLGRLGVSAQPLVACVHYTIIFAVAYLTLADPAAAKEMKRLSNRAEPRQTLATTRAKVEGGRGIIRVEE